MPQLYKESHSRQVSKRKIFHNVEYNLVGLRGNALAVLLKGYTELGCYF